MIFFGQKIEDLKIGEGFLITYEEWKETKLKTPLPSYYFAKYNRGGVRVLRIMKTPDGFYIEKLEPTSSNRKRN
jgi:hypothetical protein